MTTQNATRLGRDLTFRDYLNIGVVLFKLRVVSLLLVSAVGGAFLGAQGWPGWGRLLTLVLVGGMSAAGASALNQYWERDRDKLMKRTSKRPLPAGTIDQKWIPAIGIALIVVSVGVTAFFNPMMAFYLGLGAFIYVVIYTIWLKPLTLLNIVIGGAAGSAAVMSGGAAVGAAHSPAVIVLALVLFVWTPCHFWSLAIKYRDDYARADVPMLPTLVSPKQGGWWVLSHTIPTVIGSLLLALFPFLGWLYFIPVLWFGIRFIASNIRLIRSPSPENAGAVFMQSNIFLTVVLVAIMVDTLI